MLAEFPDDCLRALPGRFGSWRDGQLLGRAPYKCWIAIPLGECELQSTASGEMESLRDLKIWFEFQAFPVASALDLQDKAFRFPVNPEPGYVDGSLYLHDVHNPVDLTVARFGRLSDEQIQAEFDVRLCFEYEGTGFRDRAATLATQLTLVA